MLKVENKFCWSQHKKWNKLSKPVVQVVFYSLIGEENELHLEVLCHFKQKAVG